MNGKELEARLVKFSIQIIGLVRSLPDDRVTNHLGGQLLRSGTSPALNYGEALGAESTKDFVHKLGVVLKELRESLNCLQILAGTKYISERDPSIDECNQLASIFVKSIVSNKKKQRDYQHPSAQSKPGVIFE